RLQRGRDDIRVRVRYPAEERQRLTDLERIRIRTRSGAEVPLLSVADIEFAPGYTSISRKDGMRNVAVLAQVDTAVANTREISEALESSYFPLLRTKYPSVYVSVQGEKKRMAESMGGLKFGFPLAILGIFIVVATVFRSYVQPLIILVTVPFGILGAVYGHMVMGLELSIMSMFGMVALTGVVVNDAIVLIECVNRNLAEGMDCFEAIREGGVRRFRPVLLTSLSTVGGLTPMIIETDFQAQFLIPMALSLAAGVAFATVITLVLIPGLLAILNDGRRFYYRLRYGQQPTRELVEPASSRHDLAEVL
ncbi:MAG: efflux RND transporter permease subunit, partial [Verrucomicrobia bacterium]|nr:efflux RND transporter permease subunit [Verrucomicrobiota bacterium]